MNASERRHFPPEILSRIVDIAEDAIISIDARSRICIFNHGAERIFGYRASEMLGEPLDRLIPERFRQNHSRHVSEFARSKVASRSMSQRGPIYGLRKDGSEFPAEASISHVEAGDEQILTVILRDVSESRAAEQEMRETLREKEVLLREVHHRVKNNLQVIISLLGLQARTTAASPLRAALEESQARIRSMALIHEQLYQTKTFADVNLPEYLRQLSSQLFSSYQVRPNVRLETEIGDVRLGVDVAVPCGLILNELISNSLKYAFPDDRPGVVSIELTRREDGSIVLVVADDGVGTPPEISFWSTRTLGLRLVRSLVRQLDGEIEREGPPGTCYRMRFAPPAEAQAREMP